MFVPTCGNEPLVHPLNVEKIAKRLSIVSKYSIKYS